MCQKVGFLTVKNILIGFVAGVVLSLKNWLIISVVLVDVPDF